MNIRPLDVTLLYREAIQLELCCNCYVKECDTCLANETKEKFQDIMKEVRRREERRKG